MEKKPTQLQRALCKSLGKEYRILKFDGEMVIYRDFGNGFDIEISRTNTEKEDDLARIFLWLNKRIIAKIVYDVKQSDIGSVTEELRKFSEELIRTGRNNWQGIYALRQSN